MVALLPVRPADDAVRGIACMIGAMVALACMDAVAKLLVGQYSVPQILALRGAIVVPVLLAWLPRAGGLAALRTRRPGIHVVRVVLAFVAPLAFFHSLTGLPLADVTVIGFGGTFFMTALSVPLLGERVGRHRWAAVLLGLAGVLIVVRPTGAAFQPLALAAVAASAAYAMMMIVTRRMRDSERAFALLFYQSAGVALLAAAFLPALWVPMALADLGLVAVMAVLALIGHWLIIRAFSLAPVGAVAPFEYSALVWATMFGYFLFGDMPAAEVWIGSALIVAAGLYTLRREARLGKRVAEVPAIDS